MSGARNEQLIMAGQPAQFGIDAEEFLEVQETLTAVSNLANDLSVVTETITEAVTVARQELTQLSNQFTFVRQDIQNVRTNMENFGTDIQNVRTNMENAVIFADPLPLPHEGLFGIVPAVPEAYTFGNLFELPEVADVARRFVRFLQEPAFFLGAQVPKALLLIGAHGVGKTRVTRTIATEAGALLLETVAVDAETLIDKNGISLSFHSAFVAAKRIVRGAQPVVIFIKNVDSLCQLRLHVEVTGLENVDRILLIGSTTKDDRVVSSMFSGCAYNKLSVPWPLIGRRLALIRHWTQQFAFDISDFDLNYTARRSVGFSPERLKQILSTARINAMFHQQTPRIHHIHRAYAEVLGDSLTGGRVRNPVTVLASAAHEIGHCGIAALLRDAPQPLYVTLLPTHGSMAHCLLVSIEDDHNETGDTLLIAIKIGLAGRIAEQLITGQGTLGACEDLERAESYARQYVELGFSPLGFIPKNDIGNDLKNSIDDQISKILNACATDVHNLFNANWQALWACTFLLVDNEMLPGQFVINIFQILQPPNAAPELNA